MPPKAATEGRTDRSQKIKSGPKGHPCDIAGKCPRQPRGGGPEAAVPARKKNNAEGLLIRQPQEGEGSREAGGWEGGPGRARGGIWARRRGAEKRGAPRSSGGDFSAPRSVVRARMELGPGSGTTVLRELAAWRQQGGGWGCGLAWQRFRVKKRL